MADVAARLIRCFAAVFPNLASHQVPHAEPSTVAGWDSVASVTLIAAIEEDFGFELDIEEIGGLLSYERLLAYLQAHDRNHSSQL